MGRGGICLEREREIAVDVLNGLFGKGDVVE